MARNKVVLFIVEGITDQESLQLLLEEFLEEEQEVKFEVVGGDITTDRMTNRNNIKKKSAEVIKFNMKRNKFLKSDYQEVIHLVDTDGVFIDEKYIFEDINLKKVLIKSEE